MAKWGEGDPRWIVEERPDAVNVNNWHWTEKSAESWSKEKLKTLLVNLDLGNCAGPCKITKIEKCEGEATANNRKAKIILLYEWDLEMKWKGRLHGSDKEILGTITIPNLSDENTVSDLDIQFQLKTPSDEGQLMKIALIAEGTKIIQDQLQKYITCLREEFTQGMILPKKDTTPKCDSGMSKLSLSGDKNTASKDSVEAKGSASKEVGQATMEFCDLKTSATMKCTAHELYNALTIPELFAAFTNGSGQIDPTVGGKFHMFGGNVHGKIIELEQDKKIVQEWRFKHWNEGHFSTVTFEITQNEDSSDVSVTQKGIPKKELETTTDGWERYYWSAIKRTFGFGSFIG